MKNEKGLFIKNPNFWRVPRKLKKKIPKNTIYCYKITSNYGLLKNGNYGYTIKPCVFYNLEKLKDIKPDYLSADDLKKYSEELVGYCKLIKYEIDDQCKSCEISLGIDKLLK